MRRLEGWTWFDTGFFSITVPFHDTNDFYFSGHLGVCILWMVDYYDNNYKIMATLCLTNLVFQWWLLTATNAHYIIDLISGIFIAHLFTILAEPLSYFSDIFLLGLSAKFRNFTHYNNCKKCGWSYHKLEQICSKEEVNFLKKTSKLLNIKSIK